MRHVINSRKFGQLSFFVRNDATPTNTGYVYFECGGRVGTTGYQICRGGEFMGDTLCASAQSLERVATKWHRQRLAILRENNQDEYA